MSIQSDNIRASVILDRIKGCKVEDNKGTKVVVKRFIRRVYFRATKQKSYSTIGKIEAKYDWQLRIAKGAEVTDFNTDKLPRAEYMPLMC